MGRCVHVSVNHKAVGMEEGMWVELSRSTLEAYLLVAPRGCRGQIVSIQSKTVDVRMAHNNKVLRLPVEAVLFEVSGR